MVFDEGGGNARAGSSKGGATTGRAGASDDEMGGSCHGQSLAQSAVNGCKGLLKLLHILRIAQNGCMSSATKPETAITYFERLHGLLVTVHDYAGQLRGFVGSQRLVHRHARCMAARSSAQSLCIRHDVDSIRLHPMDYAEGAIRRCHAGVSEAVVCHFRHGNVAWVLFAGPLETESPIAEQDIIEGLQQLAARLAQWEEQHGVWPRGESVERGGAGSPSSRGGRIIRWLQVHHCQEVQLDDLARHLGLSRYQASRVVRQHTGKGFAELLRSTRIATAQALLSETDLAVTDIAVRSGFHDRSHFHRSFKAICGMSPQAWRIQAAAAP